jgi:crossover junction endodeoxyribonuclease RusA
VGGRLGERVAGMSAAPILRFRVAGLPIPQGSKRIGRSRGGKPILLDDNDKALKPWRRSVVQAAKVALFGDFSWQPLIGPIRLALAFGFTRPPSHPRTRPTWPTGQGTTGDVDKLARAVMDALTEAQVWRDDAQVVELYAAKDWCGQGVAQPLTLPGLIVRVWRLVEAPPPSGQILLLTPQQVQALCIQAWERQVAKATEAKVPLYTNPCGASSLPVTTTAK